MKIRKRSDYYETNYMQTLFYIFILLEEKMLKQSCLIFRDTLRTQRQITQAKIMSPCSLQRVDNWLQCLFLAVSHQIQVFLSSACCRQVNTIFAFPSRVTGPSLGWEHISGLAWAHLGRSWAGLVSALPRSPVPGASPAWAWAVPVPPRERSGHGVFQSLSKKQESMGRLSRGRRLWGHGHPLLGAARWQQCGKDMDKSRSRLHSCDGRRLSKIST